ncbi:RNA-binding S4 domain-containing protein [Paradesulfitobacterium ferrireducens]|uniref:RNA-binding S4 domain-containing protein n=1 Tax=Paradesulfitobacterium ferrireducens TaxID=2816476 RepID=UPI001A8CE383|nr:S4 domain-containing protein [Paradesulfitobacterium ferrireducens]
MRIDKYLKVSRLIKRRTVAKEICEGEKINLNGKTAKPSAEVKAGDVLTLNLGKRIMEVKVVATPNLARADEAHLLYEVLRDEKRSE